MAVGLCIGCSGLGSKRKSVKFKYAEIHLNHPVPGLCIIQVHFKTVKCAQMRRKPGMSRKGFYLITPARDTTWGSAGQHTSFHHPSCHCSASAAAIFLELTLWNIRSLHKLQVNIRLLIPKESQGHYLLPVLCFWAEACLFPLPSLIHTCPLVACRLVRT